MVTKKQLLAAQNAVLSTAAELSEKLGKLSRLATDVLGFNVQADLCGGGEIEFRCEDDRGYVDAFSTIRMEEIIDNLRK